ncbi:ABC transporter permease subunit [Luteimicrobium subarcticum]|uniref:Maltose/maltodextrin transport system permease protein n=1 Tax=Luteimicrobium subarcticum TaxID=620910 RepID=A0A2M8W1N8_9MICO|nr:ABC transporter permease subunit [Luteimicrobium subarcticum]PJI84830.1 carbohydrate ABC transporter membrane protein 1 (CUT1 family) [Luteimicrobium subarcticum]
MTEQQVAERPTAPVSGDGGSRRSPRRLRGDDSSHARRPGSGFWVKLALVAIVDALGVYGILTAAGVHSWWIVASLALGLVIVNWAYFSRRAVPAKYLVPGLLFLLVYQLFTMGYTAYVAFTNYGDGHNSTKSDAISAISAQNQERVEGSAAYPVTVVLDGGELGFAVVQDGQAEVGTADQPLQPLDGATVEGGKVTAAPGVEILQFAQIAQRSDEVTQLVVQVSDDPADGTLRTQDGTTAYVFSPVLKYDASTDTFTDAKTGETYTPSDHGNFVSADGDVLQPGWRVGVGFENFTALFQDSRVSSLFVQVTLWTFAFAFLSVATTFFLGLFLAMVFNDPRVRGRKIYRSLLILPYAFPAFLSALVWKGMLNTSYGFVNKVLLHGASIDWLGDPWLAKLSVLGVNLWLGFPYMFLICTGALQSIPGDVMESAKLDGAGPFRVFRSITLPLLMVSVAPLLIASFAFNFNNFTLIYMLTGGGPDVVGAPLQIGSTDLLISMVYSVAFESGAARYGLASAVSILIFIAVGLISWLGFRRTRSLEEL